MAEYPDRIVPVSGVYSNVYLHVLFFLNAVRCTALAGQTYDSRSVGQVFQRIRDPSNDVVGTFSVTFGLPSYSHRR